MAFAICYAIAFVVLLDFPIWTNAKVLKATHSQTEDALFKNYNALRPPSQNGEY